MRNRGVWHPGRNALLCGVVALGGMVAVALGAAEMQALGQETGRTAALIAIGLLAAILGTAMFINFLRAWAIFRALRAGRGVIARWTVPADQFARFRAIDRRFAERGNGDNDYRPPRAIPAGGVPVLFAEDGVLIGGCYFALTTTGLSRFGAVDLIASDPPMITFGTAMTVMANPGRFSMRTIHGTLRVPVAAEAGPLGGKVALWYRQVADRRVIVKPHFWRTRLRAGLAIAAVAALLAGIGFALAEQNQALANVPLLLAVAGTIVALAGLALAAIAARLRHRQHHG